MPCGRLHFFSSPPPRWTGSPADAAVHIGTGTSDESDRRWRGLRSSRTSDHSLVKEPPASNRPPFGRPRRRRARAAAGSRRGRPNRRRAFSRPASVSLNSLEMSGPPAASPRRSPATRVAGRGGADVHRRVRTGGRSKNSSLRKEVIQPQVPLRLPCYDLVPVTEPGVVTPVSGPLRPFPAPMT